MKTGGPMNNEILSVLESPEELVVKQRVLVVPQGEQILCVEKFSEFVQSGDQVFILKGPAGSGKSYLIPMFDAIARNNGLSVEICAPTGQAAKRLRTKGIYAKTLHSTLYGQPELAGELSEDRPPSMLFRRRGLVTSTVFIVDEASMIGDHPYTDDEKKEAEVLFEDGNLLSDLLLNLEDPELHNRIVFIGDQKQLSPVHSETSPCFARGIFSARGFNVREFDLSEIRRTETESRIRKVAAFCSDGGKLALIPDEWLVNGEVSKASTFESTLDRNISNFKEGTAIAVVATNALADSFNRLVRANIYKEDVHSTGVLDGVLPGDRLVVTRRNYLIPIQTGDEFFVESIDVNQDVVIKGSRGSKDVSLQFVNASFEECGKRYFFQTFLVRESLDSQSKESEISRALWVDYFRRIGKTSGKDYLKIAQEMLKVDPYFNAFRARYSFARTCHKAQGGEWPIVVVNVTEGMSSNPKWGYTAVTRAMNQLVVVAPISDRGSIGSRQIPEINRATIIADFNRVIGSAGFEVKFLKSIDYGTQLSLKVKGEEASTVVVNVFFKNSTPSSIILTGDWSELDHSKFAPALDELRNSIGVTKDPIDVPDPVSSMLERLKQTALLKHDAALVWDISEQWTVRIVLSQNGRQGSTHFNFGSKHKGLTMEKIDGAHKPIGDPVLIELIRNLKLSRGL